MIAAVTGGSGSGKSEYAEKRAMELGKTRLYVATMHVWDEEGKARVRRHRALRAGKGFSTREQYTDLAGFCPEGEKPDVILLECMSNLTANEFYRDEKAAFERITDGIRHLADCCRHLVVVTNEVGSDGISYDPETERYIRLLARVNRSLGQMADEVTEVVFGIPIRVKGENQP